MPELFKKGTERLVYKAKKFATGKTVTAHIWDPSFSKSPLLTLSELEKGLYYLDYNFTSEGTYIGLFYENGKESAMGVFRVEASLPIIKHDVKRVMKIEQGRWKIKNYQLTIYDTDGTSPLVVFDLKDKLGKPTEEAPYERDPVFISTKMSPGSKNGVAFEGLLEEKSFSKSAIKHILEWYL